MLESFLQNPEQITFGALFIGLLVYVMKENSVREQNYRDTIDKLTDSLQAIDELVEKVDDIHDVVGRGEKNVG